jgi:hypothetical protein
VTIAVFQSLELENVEEMNNNHRVPQVRSLHLTNSGTHIMMLVYHMAMKTRPIESQLGKYNINTAIRMDGAVQRHTAAIGELRVEP